MTWHWRLYYDFAFTSATCHQNVATISYSTSWLVADRWQRWQKSREMCLKMVVFRNYCGYFVVEKGVLVADNDGIWNPWDRQVDSSRSTCRFAQIVLSFFSTQRYVFWILTLRFAESNVAFLLIGGHLLSCCSPELWIIFCMAPSLIYSSTITEFVGCA